VVPTYVSTQRVEEPVENKLENLQGMDKLLDTHNHPTWNQEDINHLSRSITCNVTETAVNSLPKKKSPGLDGVPSEFYQTFRNNKYQHFSKLFHEIEREGSFPN
jgi:hypothetical protein